ncbi:phosphatidylinositol-4-phosphate 5-kinase-like protein [Strigomonas culicis]|uniref:Phosphatidylinositol-4-phosphate 5-kinase-like protein n=1 Tax=Strigomonas culicis TaxID=28005 RepID=S9U443_9TRYP|nr:phosphatidylinositol-4-phosphate 5-kinase-like protein [Strigomonas culicis]|eukprot:EPY23549.1 phosphatidylinositol-4-phosphate 5-kinase-like protein [Strigomonas culicis]
MELAAPAKVPQKKKLLNGVNITFTYPSGSKYVGGFKDGKLHGYGVYTYVPSGDEYAGEWKADMKHGHGTYTYARGDKYVGEWFAGKKNGKGLFLFANGDEYIGCWSEDKMDGYGVFTLKSNDSKYCGYWQEGVRFGKGTLYYGNGDIYEGEWVDGKEQGLGTFQEMNGELYTGEWNGGTMEGKGVIREKGLIFLVEYMGGFIIAKIPFDPLVETIEPGWERAYARFCEWLQRSKDPEKKPGRTKEEEVDQSCREENAVLKRRVEALMNSLRNAVDTPIGEDTDKKQLLLLADRNREYQMELETTIDTLRLRAGLIEGTLQEKMLEQMRLKEELKVKNMNLASALEKLDAMGSRRSRFASESVDNSGLAEGIEELSVLREEKIVLLKKNTEYQKRVTFLTSENTKLTSSLRKAEEQTEAITQAYDTMREHFDEFTRLLSLQQQDGSMGISTVVDSPEKEMEGDVVANQLRLINKINAELSECNRALERKAIGKENGFLNDESKRNKTNGALQEKNSSLQETVNVLRSELQHTKQTLQCTTETLEAYKRKNNDLSEQVSAAAKSQCVDALLKKAIDEKTERVAKLENENAELARLLEEARAQVEEDRAVVNVQLSKTRRLSSSQQHEADMEDAKKERAKLRKKIKKLTGERAKTSLELYETQISLSRVERVLQMLEGGIVVAAYVREDGSAIGDTVVKIDPVNTSQLLYTSENVEHAYQFDCCVSEDVATQTLFNELRRPLILISLGLQVSFVTLGESHTNKSTFLKSLFPFFMECLNSMKDQHRAEVYSISYRVAVIEIGVHGGYDCISRSSVRRIVKDDHGYVAPEGVTFSDCLPTDIFSTVSKAVENRIQVNGQSHMWIQIQRIRTHRVLQTTVTGRLTFLDLCGPAPLLNQVDIEAALFANQSTTAIADVICALQARQSVVPFTKSLETHLLFDLFGGNSFTTILGCMNKGSKHAEATGNTLTLLDRFAKIQNGPFLQDFISSDVLRWKEIVSALSSVEQSRKEMTAVDDVR